jgi:polar amino acid transport system permease protein
MNATQDLKRIGKPTSYHMWVGVFFIILGLIIGAFYYATQKVAYIWRWNRVPKYFVYKDTIEVTSGIDGSVESIAIGDTEIRITIKGLDKTESYMVPKKTGTVSIEKDEFVSKYDVVGSYEKWKHGILMEGLWITLKISVLATIIGVIIGIFGGLARISSNPALKWLTVMYIELIRGSPLMVQILIWYFVLGTVINDMLATYGFGRIPALWYGVASLACFAGAYVTEIVRAGIQSIHRGQTEAARSLGMTYVQSMIYIILPQALRRILPPLAGQFISLIKDSSLLGIIAIRELTKATREIVSASLQPYELYLICGILYLVLTFSLSMFVQYLERRMAVQ